MTKHYSIWIYKILIVVEVMCSCLSDQVQASEQILAPFVARRLKMQEPHHDPFW